MDSLFVNVTPAVVVYNFCSYYILSIFLVGVPKETSSILKLREAVNSCRGPETGPVVVHCRYMHNPRVFHREFIASQISE